MIGRRALLAVCLGGALVAPTAPAVGDDHAPTIRRLAGATRIETAVEVSRATHEGADTAVLARADDPADALAGAPLAAMLEAPLLLVPRDEVPAVVHDELDRLGVRSVVLLGGPRALGREVAEALDDLDVRRLQGADRVETAAVVARELGRADVAYVAGVAGPVDALAAGTAAALGADPVLLVGDDADPVRSALRDLEVREVRVVGGPAVVPDAVVDALADAAWTVRRRAGADRYATAALLTADAVAAGGSPTRPWIATGRDLPDSLAAGPAVAAAGDVLVLLEGTAPWTTRPATDLLRRWQPDEVVVLGGSAAVSEDLAWQLPVVVYGPQLPRGGSAPFPHHRMVALYGHHSSPALGVLGEQPPDRAAERLRPLAAPYGADGRDVLPTFELIVSLATSGPGPDGDYSAPSTPEQIQPWLDAARAAGAYLILDLQPGRTDFLTEARRYEAFLRQPDVGLALDPEWRLGPNERHLQQVGSVDAREVNAVSAWLADIVREEGLPQKVLMVHQFQLRMIRDRHLLDLRPELATVIHMDGQGSRAAKLDTYRVLTAGAGPWEHGFKLFFDEDVDMFGPADLLGLTPVPSVVTHQ